MDPRVQKLLDQSKEQRASLLERRVSPITVAWGAWSYVHFLVFKRCRCTTAMCHTYAYVIDSEIYLHHDLLTLRSDSQTTVPGGYGTPSV